MEDLKLIIKLCNIKMWKIADVVGVSEMTIYRWMRKYDAEHHRKILTAMKKIDPKGVETALKFLNERG